MREAHYKLLVLDEAELRKAAALLHECVEAQGTVDFSEKALAALNACIVALHGLHDKEQYPVVMLSNLEALLARPSVRQHNQQEPRL